MSETESLPAMAQVVVAGGGPVGLAAAVELGLRGVACLVIEPRETVSPARPRAKTFNVRTLEHMRRWGIADRLRAAAPLSPDWSKDVVFCTTLSGYELSRFTGVFGLAIDDDRSPELGQQAPQPVVEELLREVVHEIPSCELALGWRVTDFEQNGSEVRVTACSDDDQESVVAAEYVLGCEGSRSIVRQAMGSAYLGQPSTRPNFGVVFRAPDLWDHVPHGRAVQYWIVNPFAPGVMGPLDGEDVWWAGFLGVDRERGERDAAQLITYAIGTEVPLEMISTDAWVAHMQLVDHARGGRAFLAGDAAHLNPPFGGHGVNTGIGDAVDIGWKLTAAIDGWAGAELLDSYERERRPVQIRVIAEAEANMTVLPTELADPSIAADGPAGESARRRADAKIQATKHAEFHALDLVLGVGYEDSPIVAGGPGAGFRLTHTRVGAGQSLYDKLGSGFTLLDLAGTDADALRAFEAACDARRVPLTLVELKEEGLRDRYGADFVLVRPDQYVAWSGDELTEGIIDVARGAQ